MMARAESQTSVSQEASLPSPSASVRRRDRSQRRAASAKGEERSSWTWLIARSAREVLRTSPQCPLLPIVYNQLNAPLRILRRDSSAFANPSLSSCVGNEFDFAAWTSIANSLPSCVFSSVAFSERDMASSLAERYLLVLIRLGGGRI